LSDQQLTGLVIKTIKFASKKDLIRLYTQAGWWDTSYDKDPEFLNHIVEDSAVFIGAFLGKKIIGMGRALSDLASDAYIQDVAVLKEYRGKGIGRQIIQALISKLKENGVDWIGLVAQPGTSYFYEKLGFEVLKDHVPLKYKG
jgi:aralkylamine N-acetyltransferase